MFPCLRGPSLVLDFRDPAVNKPEAQLCPRGAHILMKDLEHNVFTRNTCEGEKRDKHSVQGFDPKLITQISLPPKSRFRAL